MSARIDGGLRRAGAALVATSLAACGTVQVSHEEVVRTVIESWTPSVLDDSAGPAPEHDAVEIVGAETTARFEHASVKRVGDVVRVRARASLAGDFPASEVASVRVSDTTTSTHDARHGDADSRAWLATGLSLGLGGLLLLIGATAN